jgi:hypothetical protein
MAAWIERGIPSAGLYAGPGAWLISTQANYSLVPWVCANKLPLIPLLAAGLAAVSLFGCFLSWRAFASAASVTETELKGGGRPRRFLAAVAMMLAVLFALVIVVHGLAGLTFNGCER